MKRGLHIQYVELSETAPVYETYETSAQLICPKSITEHSLPPSSNYIRLASKQSVEASF